MQKQNGCAVRYGSSLKNQVPYNAPAIMIYDEYRCGQMLNNDTRFQTNALPAVTSAGCFFTRRFFGFGFYGAVLNMVMQKGVFQIFFYYLHLLHR